MLKKTEQHGFTLLEIMVVLAIIVVLAAIAIPLYRNYIVRAHVADLIVNYEEIKTTLASSYDKDGPCTETVNTIEPVNLRNPLVALDIGMETVNNGFAPYLRVCAEAARHGKQGIQVATAAHEAFAKLGQMAPGAVVGTSLVSFAVPLAAPETSVCTQMTYTTSAATGCAGAGGLIPGLAPQQPTVAAPSLVGATQAPTPQPILKPPCKPPEAQMIERQVMTFGSDLDGYVMNQGDLDTGGDMHHFSAEVAVVGGAQVAASGMHGATILSYATPSSTNEFLIWKPSSVTIEFQGRDLDTGVNINDGQNHRISVTWESSTGDLLLYDNGQQVWRGTVNQGGTIGGNGKLVLGQDQDTYGGGFGKNDAFQGQVMAASLANVVAPPDRLASGPLHTLIDKDSGLITSVVTTPAGPADTTGRHTYTSGGSMQAVTQMVDSGLYVTSDCN